MESHVAIDGAATNVTFQAVLRNNAHLLPRDCWLQAGPAVGSPRGEETRRAPQSPEESSKGVGCADVTLMNKFVSSVSCLAALGSLLSGLLVFLHYYPDISHTYLCHGTFLGDCDEVNESSYATLFGFPIAAYGLFFYLVIWSTMLVADYAQGSYGLVGFTLLFPQIILALLVDLVLLLLLIKIRLFCFLCFLTYTINLSLLVVFLFWLKWLVRREAISLRYFKDLLSSQWQSPERKAASSYYLLFIAFLGFAVFSTTYILKVKTASIRLSQSQIESMLQHFYSLKVESIDFPASNLIMGSPKAPVKIIAFTDFLCAPCQRLFDIDRKLRLEFKEELSIAYYNYPLDSACNPYVKETSHPFSCIASKAVIASADLNVFESYLNKLFEGTNESTDDFSKEKALKISNGLSDSADFAKTINLAATSDILRRDIDLAEKLKIRATPTLFIDGRRVDGVPPQEVMEATIRRELADKTQNIKLKVK